VPHAWGNPSDGEALRMVSERRSALHTEAMLEGGFTIACDLQADKRGALEHGKTREKRPYCHFAQPKTRDLDPSSYLPNSF